MAEHTLRRVWFTSTRMEEKHSASKGRFLSAAGVLWALSPLQRATSIDESPSSVSVPGVASDAADVVDVCGRLCKLPTDDAT